MFKPKFFDPELYTEDEDHYWLKEYGSKYTSWPATNGLYDSDPWTGPCCRRPHSTQERRANQDVHGEPRMWRGRRAAHMLPNAWNDDFIHTIKSWKKKRKRRYQWQRW